MANLSIISLFNAIRLQDKIHPFQINTHKGSVRISDAFPCLDSLSIIDYKVDSSKLTRPFGTNFSLSAELPLDSAAKRSKKKQAEDPENDDDDSKPEATKETKKEEEDEEGKLSGDDSEASEDAPKPRNKKDRSQEDDSEEPEIHTKKKVKRSEPTDDEDAKPKKKKAAQADREDEDQKNKKDRETEEDPEKKQKKKTSAKGKKKPTKEATKPMPTPTSTPSQAPAKKATARFTQMKSAALPFPASIPILLGVSSLSVFIYAFMTKRKQQSQPRKVRVQNLIESPNDPLIQDKDEFDFNDNDTSQLKPVPNN